MAVLISVIVFTLLGAQAHALQVNTTEGVVEGFKAGDGDYNVFYGIPYAGPTDGENRFKAPGPPAPHTGVFHAIESNVICAQPSERGLIGVENCLRLNIFTKNVTVPKPVIVFLKSEEYTTTKTEPFTFKRFIEANTVFVTLNFRLSIFGFLCLGVQDAPGNAGLKDVIQGLKWINLNIANFGGDPKNVVLMGHGSGAAMVDLITMAPQANGLVHKAVALSGSSLSPWAVAYDPIGYAEMLGSKLGYTGKSKEDLAKLLVHSDISVLQTALNEFHFRNNTPLFAPCVEDPKLNPKDTVLADAPITLLQTGAYHQIPYITGYTTREGTLRAHEAAFGDWLNAMQVNFSDFIEVDLKLGNNASAVISSIRDFYFSYGTISMNTIDDYLDYQGDTLVVVSVIRGAKERSVKSAAEVRLFEFGYLGTMKSDWVYNTIPLNGARHGAILNYLFDYDLRPNDVEVRKSMVSRFAEFAYTGSPNPVNSTYNATWPPIKENLTYLYIGGSDVPMVNQSTIYVEEARTNPHFMTTNFWNDIIRRYYYPPASISSSGNGKVISSIIFVLCSQFLMYFL